MELMKMNNLNRNGILIFLLLNIIGCLVQAQDSVDIKKLEDKYWTAKDDEYGVIQNRTFSKVKRFYISAVYGPLINDPYAKARALGFMGGYFLSEDLGIEFSYMSYDSTQNDTVTAYETQFGGAKPDYNLIKSSKTLSLVYTPFYAKMALMNKSIMYFDMGFTAGLGLSEYEIQKVNKDGLGNKIKTNELSSSMHMELGLMQQLFINQNIALRLDIKNTFYKQDTKQYEIGIGAPESTRSSSSKSANDTTITFGFTFFN
jgi:outer membrane beta-barrel protein